jgi:hypothetical protein
MKRLFVVGCSFTKYFWPTWADIIGREYDHYENWAISGLGNRAIAERLTELVVRNDITADDTIIVQWTDFHRFDIHSHKLFKGWVGGGSVFTYPNFYRMWVTQHWEEESFMMHSFNFIKMGITLLESLPCKWYVSSMNDLVEPINNFPHLEPYRKVVEQTDRWFPPMNQVFLEGKYRCLHLRTIDKISGEVVEYIDKHPTPVPHYNYVAAHIAPKLGITPNQQYAINADSLLDSAVFDTDISLMFPDLKPEIYAYN